MEAFDLIVIGTGTAAQVAASRVRGFSARISSGRMPTK
jgi:pyruvate/2-oxoglutarate dehydrogenase complex dihydrolipoamide dehydrogenase (E3) component